MCASWWRRIKCCSSSRRSARRQHCIQKYLNGKKVPQLFVATGASKWGHYKENPWTMGFQTDYVTESIIYASTSSPT